MLVLIPWIMIYLLYSTIQPLNNSDQPEKSKTPKFISNSLITPSVWLYNHSKQVRQSLAINLHIHNLMIIINETYSNYKLISEKSIFKNWEQNFTLLFFWLVLVWPLRKQDVFQEFSDWFILKNSDWFIAYIYTIPLHFL